MSGQDHDDSVLALTQVYLALIACGYVVQALGTLRHEETGGRLEPMLAGSRRAPQVARRPAGRGSWAASSWWSRVRARLRRHDRLLDRRVRLHRDPPDGRAGVRARRARHRRGGRPAVRASPAGLRSGLGRIRSNHLHRAARLGPPAPQWVLNLSPLTQSATHPKVTSTPPPSPGSPCSRSDSRPQLSPPSGTAECHKVENRRLIRGR